MSSADHNYRFAVMHRGQHPYRHPALEVQYANDALPGVEDLKATMDWLVALLYPRTQESVATVGDLPAVGNTLLDYRVVLDDGDGKAASYRWEQREGEASASWHKIYDMDWGEGSILSNFLLKTQDVYVYRYGLDDRDENGDAVTGTLAGQSIYGGNTAGTNLTLFANSGDGTGSATGYVQLGDDVRPIADDSYELGTTANRWAHVWAVLATVGTLGLGGGSITDTSGEIDFGDENLSTTGTLGAGAITGTSLSAATGGAALLIEPGSITDSSGEISFGDENLTTTGTAEAFAFYAGTLTVEAGSIYDASGDIAWDGTDLSDIGVLGASSAVLGLLDVDDVRIDGSTVSTTAVDADLILAPNGAGVVDIQAFVLMEGFDADGACTVVGDLSVDNLKFDGNVVSSTDTDGLISFAPNGNGWVTSSAKLVPTADGTLDLGAAAARWNSIYLDGALGDGTDLVTIATLLSLRDINSGVGEGMSLFWDGAKWVASLPDTEVDHGSIGGLDGDDHAQYALLAGRSGGQVLKGGSDASETLELHSTSHATQGAVIWKGVFRPDGDNTRDLGAALQQVRDIYVAGQLIGARLQNATTAGRPSANASTKGRLVYDTDLEDIFVDRGGTWKKLSVEKYVTQDSTNWNGSQTTVAYTVSSEVSDARECIWAFYANGSTFEQIACKITKSQTQVTVTVTTALPSGTYTLVGIG